MFIKVFTLSFNPLTGSFDDEPMQRFLQDKNLISVTEHFHEFKHQPYLTLVITYEAANSVSVTPVVTKKEKSDKKQTHWRDLVSEEDAPLFETIREWRNQTAKTLGIPSYVIFNNQELAALIKTKPTTVTALSNIEGFGKGKVEKYGQALIQFFIPPADSVEQANG
ncbi:MAG: HRDC domain-containing protein [Methylococcales bacterium]|mgnify:CR=1 FL=1|jgi:superfamily II DNA helicase RecQ|nr:HRDC domain-containing protein [Methylococcales bacterium]MBT7444649.1 HRDC domain-containing protein [Methylococcales bacterium]